MDKEQRRKASIDLTKAFFHSYSSDWRLTKVLAIRKLIAQRHDFYQDVVQDTQHWGENNNLDAFIAQDVHNGLHHDAIAECVQYVEDLFALIQATKQPNFFVRNIITYNAGKITENIKSYKPTRARIIEDFFLPKDVVELSVDRTEVIDKIDELVILLSDTVKFYQRYWFFYNQYKHGLSIAIRGYGNMYNDEQIKLDKAGELKPMVAVYDNKSIKASKNTHKTDGLQMLMIQGFSQNVSPHINTLMNENNYLRLIFTPDAPEFDIDLLVEQAFRTRACINILKSNYESHLKPRENSVYFQLLGDDFRKNDSMDCTITFRTENGD